MSIIRSERETIEHALSMQVERTSPISLPHQLSVADQISRIMDVHQRKTQTQVCDEAAGAPVACAASMFKTTNHAAAQPVVIDKHPTVFGDIAAKPSDSRDVETHLAPFTEISLEETIQSAQMLERIDNKYTINKAILWQVLADLRNDFRILTIEGKRIFSYRSCYFDDDARCYWEHHQGKRQRFKVRTRQYVDTGEIFFEIKLKGKRGQTDKIRERCDDFVVPEIANKQLEKVRDLYEFKYQKSFCYALKPALIIPYNRLTLVSVLGGERMTVDTNIGFETPSGKRGRLGDDFVIVETKSADGRGAADRVLKKHHIRQAEGCSKYCLGLILAGEVSRYNSFRTIIKFIKMNRKNRKTITNYEEISNYVAAAPMECYHA